MTGDAVASLLALALVLVACMVGAVVAVRVVVRALRLRTRPPTGLLRAGSPAGTDDPAVAARRAEGTTSWTRIGGGGL